MSLVRDFRLALRQLSKTPIFSITLVFTLAVGIGASTLVFSLVEGILLRPLPFTAPDRLVLLGDHLRQSPNVSVTPREIATYTNSARAFSSLGAFVNTQYELSGAAVPETIQGARLSASTFSTLGVQPLLGRTFTPQEDDSHQPVAVISYALWTNRFHRDPNIAGQAITLDRRSYTILGVMPRSFEFPLTPGRLNQVQLWVPLSLTPQELSDSAAGFWGFNMVARLQDGVTVSQAAQDADRVAQQIMRSFPPSMSAIHIRGDVTPLLENAVSDSRPLLRTLFAAVSVVLLIICVNAAILLLVRTMRRRREYAVRLALGAGTLAVLRPSLCEGLSLSLAGGLLGLVAAAVALPFVVRFLPDSLPRINSVALNPRVALYALLLATVGGVLSSLLPAFAALRTNLLENLKQNSPTGTHATSHHWMRSALVISEIAVALMLLTASGVLLRSYTRMLSVDPGFHPENLLVAGYQLPTNQYPNNRAIENFNRNLLERLSAQPAMQAAGITSLLPANGSQALSSYTTDQVSAADWKLQFAEFALVYGDYFRAMRIPLIEGRFFTPEDRDHAPLVAIVNQSMAKQCWPGQSAIGKHLHAVNPQKGLPWTTIIGVVGDTRTGPRDQPVGAQMYFPMLQPEILSPASAAAPSYPSSGYLALRSALPPQQMAASLRSTVASVDPQLALSEVRTMDDAIANIESPRRFNTSLISAFAAGALLLAMIGIYAVVAFSVSARDQEIAIRMALGAQRHAVARLVLAWGLRTALLGCVLGVLASAAISRLITSLLFEVSPTDPLIYAASVALMILLALVACAIPALRAATADPIRSLRTT